MKRLSKWDILTILTLVAAIALIFVYWSIFADPDTDLNPFPNPTAIPTISIPSPTATLLSLPPTWTPTPFIEPTRRATSTPYPTITPFSTPAP